MEPDSSIYTDYFRITRESQEKYGPRTVLFMQVGAFFEIYGTKEPGGEITRSQIVDVCSLCGGLAMSEKKAAYGKGQILMAGFRDYTLDKHVQKMMDADYTAVVYVQVKTGVKITRELSNVFSPGTFLPSDTDSGKTTNNIMCIWVERFGQKMVCGLATINIFTGKSEMFEYETAYELTPCAFDDLERAVSVHCPSEVILVSDLDEPQGKTVLQYSGVKCRSIHRVNSCVDVAASRCTEQKYMRHVISAFFKEDTADVCQEFHMYPIATQAFCYLLNFVQEHTPSLVKNIALPTFYNASTTVVLANHTLKQLNIIDDDSDTNSAGNLRSVAAFLNKCCSALGRRRFYSQLVNPTFDPVWLNSEYDATAKMLEAWDLVDPFRKICREICDMEKMGRQLVSRKLVPESVFRLYKSVVQIQQINVCLAESREIMAYLISEKTDDPNRIVETWTTTVLDTISRHLCVDKCAGILSQTSFDQNIIKEGVSPSLDDLVKRKRENEDMFDQIRSGFNRIMALQEAGGNAPSRTPYSAGGAYGKTDYVRVHETEKSGSSLQLTKKRSGVLKKYLAEQMKSDPQSKLQFGKIHVLVSEIHLVSAGSSNDDIEFPLLNRICREILSIKDEMNGTIAKAYAEFLAAFERDALVDLTHLSNYIARLDVLQCKAYIARTYGYTRPFIDDSTQPSYVDVQGLRHCLIEQIQTSELYVANDIRLASSGILLYGTNAVGKTSLIRALGVAVIMAQAGLYVPAAKFVYRPYKAIYSRILGNDNLFKNLSTFAVEMSELRVILNHADESSLVLGDELCSGTESESALSIFMAGLMHLSSCKSAFIFATHFHEITRFAEMQALTNVALKHMAVHYDRELDALVYDRVLKDGQGDKVYGLEVAKSLHLPDAFLDEAYRIRNTYFPDARGALCASPSPKYNAQKLRGTCEKCFSALAEEVHHLQEQRLADEAGFIGGVHKNHPGNLMALCEKCHREEHAITKPKIVKKKTTKGIAMK
jgi:DNA mismatch repair protein MutS